jgi:OmpA-OmpF porin, OOP family
MSDSMFASLLNTLDRRTVGEVAHALGQPEQSVSHGMETSIAALMGGMASKSQDPGTLQKVLDTVSGTGGDVSWSQMASSLTAPSSSVMTAGKRVLSTLFGSKESAVVNGISRASGITTPGSALTLLSMAAPVVMSFLTRRLRDGGMNISGLSAGLQRESATIRNALPAGISELFWPAVTPAAKETVKETVREEISPVIAQTVQHEEHRSGLLAGLVLAALGVGLLWFLMHAHRPPVQVTTVVIPRGTANRLAEPPTPTINTACTLPSDVKLPADGVASRLLAYVQTPSGNPAGTWINADQLLFDSGASRLRSGSEEQLNNIATVMKNCPNVNLIIAGHTDNVGGGAGNLRLSQNRANTVRAELIAEGVSPDRLTTKGFGGEFPIADNNTAEGRAENRRVAMRVAQK